MCEPLKVQELCTRKQLHFGIDRNLRVFGQGGITQNPKYCHDKVFILLDKGNFSSVVSPPPPPGGTQGRCWTQICLFRNGGIVWPAHRNSQTLGLTPSPASHSTAPCCFPPLLYVLKYGSCASREVYRCHSASYMSVTGINLHLFAYCFISFYDNVLHNII